MRIKYDSDANAAYIYLTEIPNGGVTETIGCDSAVGGMINLDFDAEGRLLGIEVLQARQKLPKALLDKLTAE